MITLYGSTRSSAGRCVWALEEIGVPYTLKEVDMRNKEHKSAEFLKINPNGKVPAMVDGDLTLFESMAINYYLAEAYKKELLGKTPAEKGLVQQWSYWSIAEMQSPMIQVFIQKVFVPAERRDDKVIEENMNQIPALMTVLNNALEGKKYLVGNEFTLADLNASSVIGIAHAIGFDMKPYSNVNAWLGAIADRPSFQKYMGMRNAK